MSLSDFINPWGALRRARVAIADLRIEAVSAHGELREAQERVALLEKKLSAALDRADSLSLTALARSNENQRLNKLIARGHFRNPKTGRIGKRGETFE